MNKKILFVLTLLPSLLLAQHTIKGTFTPAKEFKFAFLYRVTAETSVFINNANIAEDGSFEMTLDEKDKPGTYRIVYAQPQDEYNFDLLYNGKEDIVLEFDLEKGVTFVESSENKMLTSYNKSMSMVGASINNYYSQNKKDVEGFNSVFKILNDTQNEFEKATEGTLAYNFIKAGRPYTPNEYEDVLTFSKHVKDTYFTPIDFGNETLQNSNFLIESTLNYVFGFSNPENGNEDFKSNINDVAKASKNHPKIQKVLLEILWNQFAQEENETVANHIATNYLIQLANNTNDTELSEKMTYFKNASIGNIAPDFEIKTTNNKGVTTTKKLSKLDTTNNYLIFFWSTTCSHCLDEIPKLKAYAAGVSKDQLQVIAIALDNDLYRWKNMTYDYPEFLHVFGQGKWDNPIGNNYNVGATPSYFMLDKNKKIIGKPYDFEAFKIDFEKLPIPKKTVQTIDQSYLIGSWTDSREEKDLNPDGMIFRPTDYKTFPPSRFRFKMELAKDGTCKYMSLSPTDRHGMANGTWSFNEEINTLTLMNTEGSIIKSYKIETLEKELLLLKNI
jgi:thiol-disulfide isomerase/thioredoxin